MLSKGLLSFRFAKANVFFKKSFSLRRFDSIQPFDNNAFIVRERSGEHENHTRPPVQQMRMDSFIVSPKKGLLIGGSLFLLFLFLFYKNFDSKGFKNSWNEMVLKTMKSKKGTKRKRKR